MAKTQPPQNCELIALSDALARFVEARNGVQGSRHIKPLHWYVACRLVIEGGFLPEEITPRPPFKVDRVGPAQARRHLLIHDRALGEAGERTVLGGLKTKDVDVVVSKSGIGPCIAVSMKGTLNAFRNLTNRMEEAVGDCTNLHIAYPALVYGFLHVMRANREGPILENGKHFLEPDKDGNLKAADVAIWQSGDVADSIVRYHEALSGLAGRKGVRNDLTRYEAIALALVRAEPGVVGELLESYPVAGSPLLLSEFFRKVYETYDQRFIYGAPALEFTTRRIEWDPDSPALRDPRVSGFEARLASS